MMFSAKVSKGSPSPALGGFKSGEVQKVRHVYNLEEEIYTKQNSALVDKMVSRLKKLVRPDSNDLFLDNPRAMNDLYKQVKKNPKKYRKDPYEFIWQLPVVQKKIQEALLLAEDLKKGRYAQDDLMLFMQAYINIINLPAPNTLIQNTYGKYSDSLRNKMLFLEDFWPLYKSNEFSKSEYIKQIEEKLEGHGLYDYYENQMVQMRYKFRVVLVDGLAGKYEISRYIHLGVIAVGVFYTPTVFYDGNVNNSIIATIHDFAHVENYWYQRGWSNDSSRKILKQMVKMWPRSPVQKEEERWREIDIQREWATDSERESLDDEIFQNVHEDGVPITRRP